MSNEKSTKKIFGLFRSKSTKAANLGSGTTLKSSFDPYSPPPNLQQQQKRSRSKSVGREPNRPAPSTPPPLPTIRKFASAHDLRKSAKIPHESILHHLPSLDRSKSLSTKSTEDDDNVPLVFLQSPTIEYNKHWSLLSDREEEDDKDLIPIAVTTTLELQSAADKYKERVKERLNMEDDDDDLPISSLTFANKKNTRL